MLVVHLVAVVLVAHDAFKGREIPLNHMAVGTIVPFTAMAARVNGEQVEEGGVVPGRRVVADGAIRGETGRNVVGLGVLVIALVTGDTCCGGVVITA